ncbi:MAG: hypothetical protein IKI31_03715, partial [Treponema sp.]|nr:hypothetical protein [Treponema sp.]
MQVKSSQVKSSQVKSSNIIFSLFLLLLLFSCADISNYKKDISFAFAPSFLASRASFPYLEDNTEVLCVAKLYTHGTNVDVLTQERTFRGTWSDLVNNHEFRFEDANVWCKGYVKATVSYSYVEDSTGISEQKTVVLQGKSDTSSFIRG